MSNFTFERSVELFSEYTHKNGLKVLVGQQNLTPICGVMITYLVGSRHEAIGYTGATHLLEHLMFKGSENFNKELRNGVDHLEDYGAILNATTWNDRTNYFVVLPKEHLSKAIEIEADRMRKAFIREEDRQSEMTVVRNEFDCDENDAFSVLIKNMWATAYQAHPYHHATIGWKSDIEGVPIERLRKFYDTFYWPNNAVMTVFGDVDIENVLNQIDQTIGKISHSPHAIPHPYTEEPRQFGQRRFEIIKPSHMGLVGLSFKSPKGSHADMITLQLLAQSFAGGKSSPMHKKYVDGGLAIQVFFDVHPFYDNGLISFYVWLAPGVKHAEVERLLMEDVEKLKTEPFSEERLAVAKNQLKANRVYQKDGIMTILSTVNESIALGDWTRAFTFDSQMMQVTSKCIAEVANKYFIKSQSTVGYFIPEIKEGA